MVCYTVLVGAPSSELGVDGGVRDQQRGARFPRTSGTPGSGREMLATRGERRSRDDHACSGALDRALRITPLRVTPGSRPVAAVISPRVGFPVVVSLCGCHLLGDRLVGAFVSHSLEALAVELGEADAVGLAGDVEVEDGPDEREAAVLAGEPAHDLGAAFDLPERALEQVGRPPSPAVARWVAQVHDERVQIVGQAPRCGREAFLIELACERLESLLAVADRDRVVERLPVRPLDPFAFALGQLGVEVASSVNIMWTST
jgi:hypothetical protein